MAQSPEVAAMLARARARIAQINAVEVPVASSPAEIPAGIPTANTPQTHIPAFAGDGEVTYNAEQREAITRCVNFENVVICGSAGTGKTTIMKKVGTLLSQHPKMPLLHEDIGGEIRTILAKGSPGIVAVSFTNTAVNNIARALDGIIPAFTIHTLLQFRPVIYSVGETSTKRFEPLYDSYNKLPSTLKTIIVEESGVVSIALFEQLLAALPDPNAINWIFLGDLFQLDPPYDPAILGFTLVSDKFKKVELTQVYRQKLTSPILRFALDIKEQKMFPSNKFAELNVSTEHGTLVVKPWKHKLDEFKATLEAAKFLRKQWEAGEYLPEKDVILLAFNKRFGSTELNILISDWFGKARGAIVHEIIAGYEKRYLAIGDHVMVNKRKGVITSIEKNPAYLGKVSPQLPSATLDRFGFNGNRDIEDAKLLESDEDAHDEIDRLMAASLADNEDRMRSASHIVGITFDYGGSIELSSGGDFGLNKFDFAYCMTCYKAQGSEWDTVYIFTHKSHAVMLNNEFFYTAVTRAKKKCVLVCEPDHLGKVMTKQGIPGANWQQKSAYFKRALPKLASYQRVNQFVISGLTSTSTSTSTKEN